MRRRKVKRSAVYHSINTVAPVNHVLRARNDVMGSMVIVALVLGCLSVMRLILTCS
ncbi:MAG TPA: hypothetical protein VGI03_10440 [Verrucomicrobiae bacterium]